MDEIAKMSQEIDKLLTNIRKYHTEHIHVIKRETCSLVNRPVPSRPKI